MYKVHEVIHFAVPNIPSRFSRTASYALSNIFTPLLMDIADFGTYMEYIKNQRGSRIGTYLFEGSLTNKVLADKFGIPYKNLDFFIA